ncbi:MAG: MOSC domain-containing protein [Gemmatimonadaceae bacterium]|nr:MOSC domain-containing protein [Gemmatimonadaceae bacterium]MCW5826060.1 MOSC domain-containing protein [Gemmatimonadaceae bacterium]
MASGRLEAIWQKRAHRGPMDAIDVGELIAGEGLLGSVGRSRRRQVTIIEREVWDRVQEELQAAIPYAARRANLMISGVRLEETRDRVLRIGVARVRIGGHTTPCERMDEAQDGLRDRLAPHWGGGAFAQVIAGGTIRVGDVVEWESTLEE